MITTQPHVDLAAVKSRQQATWSSGDYAVIGTTLAITGELLCEAVELRPGQRVLDVAAGNGNAPLGRCDLDRLCRGAARTRARQGRGRAPECDIPGSRRRAIAVRRQFVRC